ncbi:MAG: EexN family lipoprotein [Woeseiaceae bacterium]|nr:EexN family lipoprotein [Woeseiaceae bacterium]
MAKRLTTLLIGAGLAAGCGPSEPPPRTVTEFLENPLILEAAVVRCNQDRAGNRYNQECINAREAVKRIQAKEEEARRRELEERSEAKRRALRRTQQAQAEARRRAVDAERRRKEAEYLAQFGVLPPTDDQQSDNLPEGNLPIAVIPETQTGAVSGQAYDNSLPASDGGNAPTARTEPAPQAAPQPAPPPVQQVQPQAQPETDPPEPAAPAEEESGTTDLEAVREELRRRAEDDGN